MKFRRCVLVVLSLVLACNTPTTPPAAAEQEVQSPKSDEPHIAMHDSTDELLVDYDEEFEAAIAEGVFDQVDENISQKDFPNLSHERGEVTLKVRLFSFDREMSFGGIVKEVKRAGFRPATLREIVAYGAKYRDEQRRNPIAGLGSVLERNGDRDVPCLAQGAVGRSLYLSSQGDRWPSCYRFLAVHAP